jgi:hypothetical protein
VVTEEKAKNVVNYEGIRVFWFLFFWNFRVFLFMVEVEFLTINYELNVQFLKQICKPSLQILMEAVVAVIKLLEVFLVWFLNNSLCWWICFSI